MLVSSTVRGLRRGTVGNYGRGPQSIPHVRVPAVLVRSEALLSSSCKGVYFRVVSQAVLIMCA